MDRDKQRPTIPGYVAVKIRGKEILFPNHCPCCGAIADQKVKIEKEKVIPLGVVRIKKELKLEVPCCAQCAPYFRWNQSGGYLRPIGMLIPAFVVSLFLCVIPSILLLVAFELLFKIEMPRWLSGFVLFGGAVAATGYWVYRQIRKKPRERLSSHLCCDLAPVSVKHFDASTVTMGFLSGDYAESFRNLNERNVVLSTSDQPAAKTGAAKGVQFMYYDLRGAVQTRKVFKDALIVGSNADCDFRMENLAPEECSIYSTPQGYYALDLSGNLSVNGNHGSGYLQNNDVLQIGRLSVRISLLS